MNWLVLITEHEQWECSFLALDSVVFKVKKNEENFQKVSYFLCMFLRTSDTRCHSLIIDAIWVFFACTWVKSVRSFPISIVLIFSLTLYYSRNQW